MILDVKNHRIKCQLKKRRVSLLQALKICLYFYDFVNDDMQSMNVPYKIIFSVPSLYAASCSGISPGGLKWFPCVQCLLGEEGRVSASVDTRL